MALSAILKADIDSAIEEMISDPDERYSDPAVAAICTVLLGHVAGLERRLSADRLDGTVRAVVRQEMVASRGNGRIVSTSRDANGNLVGIVSDAPAAGGGDVAARLEAIEQRLTAIEASIDGISRRGLEYRGTWSSTERYRKGDATTHRGQLFIAVADAPDAPPLETRAWQLALKR